MNTDTIPTAEVSEEVSELAHYYIGDAAGILREVVALSTGHVLEFYREADEDGWEYRFTVSESKGCDPIAVGVVFESAPVVAESVYYCAE